jgi:hypothetical protein
MFQNERCYLLHEDIKICYFCNCQNEIEEFFSQENDLVFDNGVCSIVEALGHQNNPSGWYLFIDSAEVSLKAVLLHNMNTFPSVHLAHAANMKESMKR